MRQPILAGGSYLSGPPLEAYFGLGQADHGIVSVTWLDGRTAIYEDVPAGTTLRVTTPD